MIREEAKLKIIRKLFAITLVDVRFHGCAGSTC
jgi:hypothetical protein